MKNSNLVVIVLAVLVVFGGWYAYTTYYTGSPTQSGEEVVGSSMPVPGTSGVEETIVNVDTGVPLNATVTLTADGFSPKSVTIRKGGTITFINEDTGKMWVASASHPAHTMYGGTTLEQHCAAGAVAPFDQCKSGATYMFTFDKVGSFNYHNHLVNGQFGTVVVVE